MQGRHELHRGLRTDDAYDFIGLPLVYAYTYPEALHLYGEGVVIRLNIGLDACLGTRLGKVFEIAHIAERHIKLLAALGDRSVLAFVMCCHNLIMLAKLVFFLSLQR